VDEQLIYKPVWKENTVESINIKRLKSPNCSLPDSLRLVWKHQNKRVFGTSNMLTIQDVSSENKGTYHFEILVSATNVSIFKSQDTSFIDVQCEFKTLFYAKCFTLAKLVVQSNNILTMNKLQ
jgi:hypothetical protein